MKKIISLLLVSALMFTAFLLPANAQENENITPENAIPLDITIAFPENAHIPFNEDWLSIKEIEKRYNVNLIFEVIPEEEYQNYVSGALNTSGNIDPDIMLYQDVRATNASFALNGALIPISDYSDWTPNFNAQVEYLGREEDVQHLNFLDGKRYFLPSMADYPLYDGGLILRDDYLEKKGIPAPVTYDDLYNILKAYKKDYPNSYPLLASASPRLIYPMTMPAFGISLGDLSSSGSNVLSWNYEYEVYFPAAISEEYREYLRFMHKLFVEGLIDPDAHDPDDTNYWYQKMADGKSIAMYTYFNQIPTIEALSTIKGFSLNLYPPLEGPAGVDHMRRNSTAPGIIFPRELSEKENFEAIVRKVDEIFFSPEAAKIWTIGVEGITYTEKNGKITYSDDLVNSSQSLHNTLQTKYGCGIIGTQLIWELDLEISKRTKNFAMVNMTVSRNNSIKPLPPTPLFDPNIAKEAALLQFSLKNSFDIWNASFILGMKNIETDWMFYVEEMQQKGIDKLCEYYNTSVYRQD